MVFDVGTVVNVVVMIDEVVFIVSVVVSAKILQLQSIEAVGVKTGQPKLDEKFTPA